MFKKDKNNFLNKFIVFFILLPAISYAWEVESVFGVVIKSETGHAIGTFIDATLTFIYALSAGFIIIRIIASGYDYMTSAGNPQKVLLAKRKLMHAVEGLVIVFSSFVFAQLVGGSYLTNFLY